MKVIKLFLSAFFILVALAIGFLIFEYFKSESKIKYWNKKVKELCEKDGGVVVYQTIQITNDEYKKFGGVNGVIFIPSDSVPEASKYDYLSKTHIKYINEMNPTVIRIEYIVYRKIDGKVLGKLVSYGRVGGDMPTGIGHDSSFSCSQITGVDTDLEKKIFSIEGVQR